LHSDPEQSPGDLRALPEVLSVLRAVVSAAEHDQVVECVFSTIGDRNHVMDFERPLVLPGTFASELGALERQPPQVGGAGRVPGA
jgi:hypothetical protein